MVVASEAADPVLRVERGRRVVWERRPARAAAHGDAPSTAVQVREQREVGAPEAVDRLLGIADREEGPGPPAGDFQEQLGLQRIGVLELVDEDPRVAALKTFAHVAVVPHEVARDEEEVERDGIRIMFTSHYHDDDDEPPHDAELTGSIYIDVDDVDGLARDLAGKVDLIYGPDDQPHGMREMAIHDNSGYVVMFGQPL